MAAVLCYIICFFFFLFFKGWLWSIITPFGRPWYDSSISITVKTAHLPCSIVDYATWLHLTAISVTVARWVVNWEMSFIVPIILLFGSLYISANLALLPINLRPTSWIIYHQAFEEIFAWMKQLHCDYQKLCLFISLKYCCGLIIW